MIKITPAQNSNLKIIKDHYENVESRKAELEELLLALAAPYQQELAILQNVPGICHEFTTFRIISKISTSMIQYANAVVTSKKYSEMRNRYLRLKKRHGHKKVIIAIARMLLTALYHMLKNVRTITQNFIGNPIFLRLIAGLL